MKKLLLSSIAVCIVFLTQAQYKKGTTFLGGSFAFSNIKTDTITNQSTFSISPSIGWAIKDNLVFGVNLGYSHSKYPYSYSNVVYYNKQNSYSAGVFLRGYKQIGSSGFSLFGQGTFNLAYSKMKTDDGAPNPQNQKSYSGSLAFGPGVAYRVNKHWQLETSLPNLAYINYNHTKYPETIVGVPGNGSSTNTFNLGSSLSNNYTFTIGVLYII